MTNVFFLKNIRKGNITFLDMLSLYIIIPYMKKSDFENNCSYDSFALR